MKLKDMQKGKLYKIRNDREVQFKADQRFGLSGPMIDIRATDPARRHWWLGDVVPQGKMITFIYLGDKKVLFEGSVYGVEPHSWQHIRELA